MKELQDHSLFLQEFRKLIEAKKFINMIIDEDEKGILIRLEEQYDSNQKEKTDKLLKGLEKAEGFLKKYPESIRNEFHAIAKRDGEEDREDTLIK
ncbi:hypothetical protein [Paenibacillus sp. NPDC057934]|uniref:hypothetical protein n=1 Tax=Paenibacillus sp. NPDC057934 TaxID=3346282 RepID=UPI0036DC9158